jgi:hypothetical protein
MRLTLGEITSHSLVRARSVGLKIYNALGTRAQNKFTQPVPPIGSFPLALPELVFLGLGYWM